MGRFRRRRKVARSTTAPLNRRPARVDAVPVDPPVDALADSLRLTRTVLRGWNQRPAPILRAWLIRSLAAAFLLLCGVLLVALVVPTYGPVYLNQPPLQTGHLSDVRQILSRNVLVLALHALACIAGFIAGFALPRQAHTYSGWGRTLHKRAGQAAIAFVIDATLFSLTVQAVTIGGEAARVSRALGVSPALLLLALLPHALPELTALFLPLAAWLAASRRRAWDQLLAATAVTVALALPVLLVCACWEVYVAPHVIAAVAG
jgi:hypothetical protein